VKLPLFTLLGLALVPWAARKLPREPLDRVILLTLFVGAGLPILASVHTVLYSETRQILFVYPLLFLLGCASLYYVSRRAFLVLTAAFACLSLWDDLALYPYEYAYFNEPARFLDVNRLFETDYWGASSRELATTIDKKSAGHCVFADPVHLYRPFFVNTRCIESLDNLDDKRAIPGQYMIAVYKSSLNGPTTLAKLVGCERVATVERILPVSNRNVLMAEAYNCGQRGGRAG
jgi:hypothetical protein